MRGGLDHLRRGARVFIKPNIVLWTDIQPFPKWGLITTSRVVHDAVALLKERGIDDITIGEGPVLLGQCMYRANRDNPDIRRMIAVKGCPPSREDVVKALHEAGVPVDPSLILHPEKAPSLVYRKYEGKPEFDESFFTVD